MICTSLYSHYTALSSHESVKKKKEMRVITKNIRTRAAQLIKTKPKLKWFGAIIKLQRLRFNEICAARFRVKHSTVFFYMCAA